MTSAEMRSGQLAPDAVRRMFDRIAPVYDLMNRVMTVGLDGRWRRLTAKAAGFAPAAGSPPALKRAPRAAVRATTARWRAPAARRLRWPCPQGLSFALVNG